MPLRLFVYFLLSRPTAFIVAADVAAPAPTYFVNLDAANTGKIFDGIGAVSAGGTSRLLVDYPEKERDEILDLLFLPGYGSALQMLKVEIGGDTFTGCGVEASHMRSFDEPSPPRSNASRGYEFWLMQEAKRRNPNITLLGLSWGFPAWVGSGALNENQVRYTIRWLEEAQYVHGLHIDWIGVVNESPWTPTYIKALRAALDSKPAIAGTQIVAADNFGWSATVLDGQFNADALLKSSVAAIGIHYPVGSSSFPHLAQTFSHLWSSEDMSTNDDVIGAGCWARVINWNYVVGNYSASLAWSPVNSWYSNLPWSGDALLDANEPWSGHFHIKPPTWATAHTTHFVDPGWRLLPHGSGSGFFHGGGSYVTYVHPRSQDWTMVIETMTPEQSLCIRSNPTQPWTVDAQNVTLSFPVDNSLTDRVGTSIHVWVSKISASSPSYFQKGSDLRLAEDGTLTIGIDPNSIVTLTTLSNRHVDGKMGTARILSKLQPSEPESSHFPIPYSDDFESQRLTMLPRYFSDMAGGFAVRMAPSGSGRALRQEVFSSPSSNKTGWGNQDSQYPITIIGDWNMRDYETRVRVYMPANPAIVRHVSLGVRAGGLLNPSGCGSDPQSQKERRCVQAYAKTWYDFGYFFQMDARGGWIFSAGNRVLDKGNISTSTSGLTGRWHEISLAATGDRFRGSWDGVTLFDVTDKTWANGWATLGSGWHEAWFDDFSMVPTHAENSFFI